MKESFLPLSRPSISEEEIAAVGDVLRSGWITTGPQAGAFEEAFRAYVGAGHCVALNSATAGMHLALHALGIGPGDEVITPSMTWVATVNLIVLAGARPVFVDVDRDTLMTSAERIEPLITPRTKLIVPVHFAGAPADMEPIRALGAARRIPVIEDAAHAAGTEYMETRIGAIGTSIFSFHPLKNLTTGEGGMFCTGDAELAARVRRLKFHGLGADAHERSRSGGAQQTEVIEPGYKYNLPDMAAVLGLGQLARLDEFIEKRTALAARYSEQLKGIEGILPLGIPAYPHRHAWHLYVVRVDEAQTGIGRDAFMAELKLRNIGTGLHFRAVHEQQYYRQHGFGDVPLPETEWNSARVCSLPLFPGMDESDVDSVVDAIRDVLA